jgi:hypothetical protein
MYVCTNNTRTHYFPGAEIPCAVARLNAGLVIGQIHDPVRGRLAVRKLLVSDLLRRLSLTKSRLSPKGGDTLPNQSAKKLPPPERQTKDTLTRPEWAVPTLADLLHRLSVTSVNPSKPSQYLGASN